MHTRRAVVVRRRCIAGVFAAALALGLAGVPGTAWADPVDDAAQAVDEAAAQVERLLEQLGSAQVAADDATARATRAREQFDAEQQAYDRAQTDARAAGVAAQQAQAERADAQAAVASFARDSYMSGSTSPVLHSLITSGSPEQMIERAALLDVVGEHRTDVLTVARAAHERAAETQTDAQTAVTDADRSRRAAEAAWEAAEAAQAEAVELAAGLQTERTAVRRSSTRRGTRSWPCRARVAAAAARRPRHRRPPARRRLADRGPRPPRPRAATPPSGARLGRRRAVRVRRQLEDQHRQRLLRRPAVRQVDLGRASVAPPTPRAPTWPARASRSPSRNGCWPSRAPARGRPAAGTSDGLPDAARAGGVARSGVT